MEKHNTDHNESSTEKYESWRPYDFFNLPHTPFKKGSSYCLWKAFFQFKRHWKTVILVLNKAEAVHLWQKKLPCSRKLRWKHASSQRKTKQAGLTFVQPLTSKVPRSGQPFATAFTPSDVTFLHHEILRYRNFWQPSLEKQIKRDVIIFQKIQFKWKKWASFLGKES